MCVSRAKGRVVTHETLGRRAFVGRPLLVVTLFGLLLLGAAAAGAVLSWTGSGDSTSPVASPSAIAEPGEPLGTIIFQGVVDRLDAPQLRTVSVPDGEPKSLRGRGFRGVEPTFSRDGSQARVVIPRGTKEFVFHNSSQWSHDGSRIAVVSSDCSHPDSTLNSVDAQGGPLRELGERELERWAPPNAGRAVQQAKRGPLPDRLVYARWYQADRAHRERVATRLVSHPS